MATLNDDFLARQVLKLRARRVLYGAFSAPNAPGSAGTLVDILGSFVPGSFVDTVFQNGIGDKTSAFGPETVDDSGNVALVQTRALTNTEQGANFIVVGRENNG